MFATAVVSLCALALSASAQLTITSPSTSIWWVAGSTDTLAWTCQTSNYTEFAVYASNPNTTLLTGNLALFSNEMNYDCSKSFTPELVAGTGYIITFTNPTNPSDVYAQTSPFEVKPLGSLYPSTSSMASSSTMMSGSMSMTGSATMTGTAASGSSTAKSNDGVQTKDAKAAGTVLAFLICFAALF